MDYSRCHATLQVQVDPICRDGGYWTRSEGCYSRGDSLHRWKGEKGRSQTYCLVITAVVALPLSLSLPLSLPLLCGRCWLSLVLERTFVSNLPAPLLPLLASSTRATLNQSASLQPRNHNRESDTTLSLSRKVRTRHSHQRLNYYK